MTPPHPAPLGLETAGSVIIVRFQLVEILHNDIVDLIDEQLSSLVEDEGRRLVVLDLTAVRKVSSAFLGRVVALHKRLLALQGRLVLCGLDPEVRRVFDLCQLSRLLHFCADEPAALAALSDG